MKFSYSITINSIPETVFRWIGTPENAKQWMTNVTKTEMLKEMPNMVGSTFRETVSEGGDGIELQGQVTDYELNRFISFHLESKVNSLDVNYRVEPITAGTQLTQIADIHWKFPVNVISLFAGAKLKQNLLAQVQDEFGRLKILCESTGNNKRPKTG